MSPVPTGARRRYVTLLFADLSESTRIAATLDAEIYADVVAALRRGAEEVVARHGGMVVQFVGDGVLAMFGYPKAQDDDRRRATEAALELHERAQSIKLETRLPWRKALGMHSGIHAGLVLVDDGDAVRGRLQPIGDPPNIAARLADAADDGEILVSVETLGPESQFFRTEGPRMVTLAGRATPLAVYRVLSRASESSRFEASARRGLSAFVGRHTELYELEGTLHEAKAGKSARMALVAPPGVGKTRLAEVFLGRARALDFQVWRGYCESYLGAEPMQPYLQMLRAIFGIEHGTAAQAAVAQLDAQLARLDARLAAHRRTFLQMLSLEPEPARGTPERAVAAMRDLFAHLATRKPVVLFIDDWQWADDATRLAAGAIEGIGGIVELTASRELPPGEASLGRSRILPLAPFSEDEAEQTIARLVPGIDPFVAAGIRRDSGGNALFLEELCHSVRHDVAGRLHMAASGSAAWLDMLIESRVARLPQAQAELVRTAAVIGNVIPAWLFEKLTGCSERDPLVESLAAQDFIYPAEGAGTLRFKHGIARDAIYAAVGLRERRALHARIADALRASAAQGGHEELFESLAYHYGAAGDRLEAARYAELAGDKALGASALDRAQAQYRAALGALDQLEPSQSNYERWSSLARRLATACVFDPSREHLDVFARAVSLALAHKDLPAAANAEFWLGYINYALGEASIAIRHFESAQARAEALGDAPLATQVRATLGQAKAAACDYDAALELFDAALAIKRQHRTASRPAVGAAYTLACKAAVLGDRGEFGPAHECLNEALDALGGMAHVVQGSVLCLQACVQLFQGRWHDARRTAHAAEQVGERVKSLYFLAMSRSLGGYADWMLERSPAALQTIADATSWLESRNRGLFISLNHGWLTEGLIAAGQFARARRYAARALARARKGDRLGEAMTWRALARAAAGGHGRRSAPYCIRRALRSAEQRRSPREVALTQLCAAQVEAARGARDPAARLLDEAAKAFGQMDMQWHLAEAARVKKELYK